MALLRGPDEIVVGDLQIGPEIPEQLADGVGIDFRRPASGFRGLDDFVSVFVGACQKIGHVALQTVEAAHAVGNDGGVAVPQMRTGVHVIDGCGYEKRLHGFSLSRLKIYSAGAGDWPPSRGGPDFRRLSRRRGSLRSSDSGLDEERGGRAS